MISYKKILFNIVMFICTRALYARYTFFIKYILELNLPAKDNLKNEKLKIGEK